MIKTICDKCGKEITGKVNIETEQIELFGDNGTITLSKELHYCDKCKKDLYCGFKGSYK